MSENLNYVGDGFEIKDGSLVIFNAEEYFGVDEFYDGENSVKQSSFLAGDELCDIVIPDGVISIGKRAFSGCKCLRSVTFSKDVASIEAGAFKGCSNLSSVYFPECNCNGQGLKIIGREAFADCLLLQEIDLPSSVIFIGDGAFAGLDSLELLTTPQSLELSESVWHHFFPNNCNSTNFSKSLPSDH